MGFKVFVQSNAGLGSSYTVKIIKSGALSPQAYDYIQSRLSCKSSETF